MIDAVPGGTSYPTFWAMTMAQHGGNCPRCHSSDWYVMPEEGKLGLIERVGNAPESLGEMWHCRSCGFATTGVTTLVPLKSGRPKRPGSVVRRMKGRRFDPREALNHPPFPLFGLPASWSGKRYIAGWGRSRRGLTSVELGHVDPSSHGSALLLIRIAPKQEKEDLSRLCRPGAEIRGRRATELTDPQLRTAEEPQWRPLAVSFDGQPVDFRLLSQQSAWFAQAEFEHLRIVLR